jgi:hypothetical protein
MGLIKMTPNELLSLQVWVNQREDYIPITTDEWTDLFADWCMELFILRNGEMTHIKIDDWDIKDYDNTYYFVDDGF